MKREHSSSAPTTSYSTGMEETVHMAPSGSLPAAPDADPCTGSPARASFPEQLGSLLLGWLESMGFRRIFPDTTEPISNADLPFSQNQLREIGKRIELLKTRASHSHNTPEPIYLDNVDLMKLLHISPRTSRLWRAKGMLRFSKVGRK